MTVPERGRDLRQGRPLLGQPEDGHLPGVPEFSVEGTE
jgi:hypothetical protein